MLTKSYLGLLASAALANGAHAGNHRHAQRHQQHHVKKDIVYETTTTLTDISWYTVFVDGNGNPIGGAPSTTPGAVFATSSSAPPAAYSTPSSSPAPVVPTSSSSYVAPTTLVPSYVAPTSAAASYEAPAVAVAVTSEAPTTSAAAATYAASGASDSSSSSSGDSSSSSSGNKRGAAYNDATLISPLVGDGHKLSWAYNWGQVSDGLSDVSSDLEFVPMLWGNKNDFFSTWSDNAQAAIDAGSKYLLSFNEPDNAGQANMDAATAAGYHKTYMNPFASKAKIGAPSITNSNTAGESVDWLSSWISACGGSCSFDFCPVHWYNTIEAGAEDLLKFVSDVQSTCGEDKTVWVTEFAPNVDSPSQSQIADFLGTVQDAFDNNATYSFVERYSYFYVSDGLLVSGGAATDSGKAFAYD